MLHSRQATSLRQEAIVVILRRKARLAFLEAATLRQELQVKEALEV